MEDPKPVGSGRRDVHLSHSLVLEVVRELHVFGKVLRAELIDGILHDSSGLELRSEELRGGDSLPVGSQERSLGSRHSVRGRCAMVLQDAALLEVGDHLCLVAVAPAAEGREEEAETGDSGVAGDDARFRPSL